MRHTKLISILVSSLSVGLIVNGCGPHYDMDCETRHICLPGDDGGGLLDGSTDASLSDGGTDGTMDGPPACDATKSPSEDPCVIDDRFGVFVDSAAGDAGTALGTKASPFGTIGAALTAAKAASKRVYICEGTYPESVAVDASKDGLHVFGGFACATWAYDAAKRPAVKPSTGVALRLDHLTALVLENLVFQAPDGVSASQSSVAAFATTSSGIILRRVKLVGGKGANGAPGVPGVTGTSTPTDASGNPGTTLAGGDAKSCSCTTGGTSVGGKGGFALSGGTAGLPALPENPTGQTPPQDGAGGGANMACISGGGGRTGADAPVANDGLGAATLGVLDTSGWTPAAGSRGVNGSPGQGGGGGGSRGVTGGGGSGGCGGCGGGGGSNGGGGGASIGLLAVEAAVGLELCELVAAKAGDGGGGAIGAEGQQAGGAGGGTLALACAGGDGGKGGKGGAGGGGAGGVSVGIAYKGTAPVADTVTQSQITISAAGLAGAGGGSKVALAGIAGDAKAMRALP